MLSKQQIKDHEKCGKMLDNGEDMEYILQL
ncbi:hypothetical protein Clopa_0804 [Clostridium pasteurianum BC1]|uniref:Uncharacterized protein n=1 Tax=Clostridium pasteurianum BC1 TaxID=86416 RepID=R4JZT3_CLOPA|nr:hypothetical protein Clopa_0804 [Clostridium pasteurianum BC1]